ncbi:Monooxygenase [Arthrobacter sp. 9AX]|nr:Monooxygenase [Arthrobacter sp. 9AX]
MGVLQGLQDSATHAPGLTLVTPSGRRVGPLRLGRPRGDDVEIARADLAAILRSAVEDQAYFIFGDEVTALEQDEAGVDVSFLRSPRMRFDLVVGADGLHSSVREMVFGPEQDLVHPLGLYIATMSLGRPAADPASVVMYNRPGRSLTVHPVNGTAGAGFIFRAPPHPKAAYRDIRVQKQVVLNAYGVTDWAVPELTDLRGQVEGADDLYFDAISRVQLPHWSRGRVTLLGDAASCVSLFGDGSSLAMSGAFTLAEALADDPNRLAAALKRYETHHRKAATSRQWGYSLAAAWLVPATQAGLTARNLSGALLPH